MSVGVSIHVMTNSPEDDETLRCFFAQTIGSEYFNPNYTCPSTGPHYCEFHTEMMEKTWVLDVGEASWLSAALLDNQERYIPSPIQRVEELISEPTQITQELVDQLEAAFDLPNTTGYEMKDSRAGVRPALEPHVGSGHRAFTVSW